MVARPAPLPVVSTAGWPQATDPPMGTLHLHVPVGLRRAMDNPQLAPQRGKGHLHPSWPLPGFQKAPADRKEGVVKFRGLNFSLPSTAHYKPSVKTKDQKNKLIKLNGERHDLSLAAQSKRWCLDLTDCCYTCAIALRAAFYSVVGEKAESMLHVSDFFGERATLYPLFSSFLMGDVRA